MRKYFLLNGTATRSEYWGVQLLALMAITATFALATLMTHHEIPIVPTIIHMMSIAVYIWLLMATSVRRCDNAGISPWWTAATILPLFGFVVWIVIGCVKSDPKYDSITFPKS